MTASQRGHLLDLLRQFATVNVDAVAKTVGLDEDAILAEIRRRRLQTYRKAGATWVLGSAPRVTRRFDKKEAQA